jgi:hypothetical protein
MAHNYEYTYRDFIEAQRLHRRSRPLAMVSFVTWFILLPVAAVSVTIFMLWAAIVGRQDLFRQLLPAEAWLLFMTIFICLFRPFNLRKIYKRNLPDGAKSCAATFSFGEEGVASGIVGRSEGRFHWNALLQFVENEKVALLYVKKKLFLCVPKRAMPEEEWQQLRAYFQNKTGRA